MFKYFTCLWLILGAGWLIASELIPNKNQKIAEKKPEEVRQVPDKMVFLSGITRIYRESLRLKPKDIPLRERFIDFLLRYGRERQALIEMQELLKLKPDDGALHSRVDELKSKLEDEKEDVGKPKVKNE